VISSQERRIWQDIERSRSAEIEEPRRRPEGRTVDDLPAAVVSGIWGSIVLVLFGFVLAGLAVGALTALAALVWRLLRG
jgi:hypothetical protein